MVEQQLSPAYYQLGDDTATTLNDKWINILNRAYNEPQRHYHSLTHIKSMFDVLAQERRQLMEPPFDSLLSSDDMLILHLAIWFHDSVYSVTTTTPGYNEIESALLFETFAQEMQLVHVFQGLVFT